jgi:hypothetical protein
MVSSFTAEEAMNNPERVIGYAIGYLEATYEITLNEKQIAVITKRAYETAKYLKDNK